MKKILASFLLLVVAFTMVACEEGEIDQQEATLEAIEINEETVRESYPLGEFSVDGIELVLMFSGDFDSSIRLSESMIQTDIDAISEPGEYDISVRYSTLTTSFTVLFTEGQSKEIVDVSFYEESYDPYALIDTFDIEDLLLEVDYSNGTSEYVPIDPLMISVVDTVKLSTEGVHDITVSYEGYEISFRIAMFEDYPSLEDASILEEQIFYEVMEMLMDDHYKNPSEELLFEGALQGMIDALDDPFTNYFDLEEAEQYQGGFEETYVGIGVRVQYIDDKIIVEGVINGGAAEEEGMMVGDIIRSVDGEEVTGQNLYEVVNKILGEEGTYVEVGVERAGISERIIFMLERRVIDNPTVISEVIDYNGQTYGLITVSTFGNETAGLFSDAIYNLEQAGIEGLIVDLRNNGGGRLDTVLSMLREFLLGDGEPIFSLEYLSSGVSQRQDLLSYQQAKKPYDIVTLINGGSASASEVFASAMSEHGDYILVGTPSYGKGTMQSSYPVSVTEGDMLNITIGKWLTPDENWVHYQGGTGGITPDILAPLEAVETAWKIFLGETEELAYDTVSERTENLQVILNAMGYNVRTDGYYDLATKEAVEDIQADSGLLVTGNVNQATALIINDFLRAYQNDQANDSQLEAALDYLDQE